jgi:5'-methylthioinosine phosphorylase
MKLAVIGGSGLRAVDGLKALRGRCLQTAYGAPSAPIFAGTVAGQSLYFLSRHGADRHLPPHVVNYRANIAALADLGVSHIVTVNIVGGIHQGMGPASWVVPDQLIDYTWGREHSFYDGSHALIEHVEFDPPYDETLSLQLVGAAVSSGLCVQHRATYGCTQGPRLETAAEIQRLARDGCDLVGMTAMPEAVLARERAIPYASLCLVVNWAAGIGGQGISVAQMQAVIDTEMPRALPVIAELARLLK